MSLPGCFRHLIPVSLQLFRAREKKGEHSLLKGFGYVRSFRWSFLQYGTRTCCCGGAVHHDFLETVRRRTRTCGGGETAHEAPPGFVLDVVASLQSGWEQPGLSTLARAAGGQSPARLCPRKTGTNSTLSSQRPPSTAPPLRHSQTTTLSLSTPDDDHHSFALPAPASATAASKSGSAPSSSSSCTVPSA